MRSARPPVAARPRAAASVASVLSVAGLLAACKPSPVQLDASTEPVDAARPDWWSPAPGEQANWDIQLAEQAVDISTPRDMYMLDLFDAVPAGTTLDYGGGATLAVPAGRNATAIATLRARSPRPIVVCLVGTGAIRLDDPDASRFPGATGTPPDRPTAPAAGSVVGWSTPTGANERFLDLNEAARPTVSALIGKRLELAKQIGCDAVAADRDNTPAFESSIDHGFDAVARGEYESWLEWLTTRAHELKLSIGLRDTLFALDLAVSRFDWHLSERCAEDPDPTCDLFRGFLNARKAVFAVEYTVDLNGIPQTTSSVCSRLDSALIANGIIKSAALDASVHERCP